MKKIAVFFLIAAVAASFAYAKQGRDSIPTVRYIEPKDEAIVDLRGKREVIFSWKANPIPGGGRKAYKFSLYKGTGYDTVVSEQLDPKTYSIEVPTDMFEDGEIYTWQVKQRDARLQIWSMDHRWRFRIKK